jgi:DNA polymerase III gamma/tau subunit
MKAMLAVFLAVGGMAGPAAAQDVASLIEKLRSKDEDEADGARDTLLKAGQAALAPLREAAAKAQDAGFKKRAAAVADRLETRGSVMTLAAAWGDRWYAIYINALKTGWVHLKAEEKEGKIVFTDELLLQPSKDQSISIKTAMTCERDEYLSPVRISMDANTPEDSGAYEGKVKEGRLILTSKGEKQAQKLKENTVVDFALLRLVTILPRTEAYPISLLELVKPKVKESAVVRFDREEAIEYGGAKVKARRFIVSDGEDEDRFYWVGAAGQLYKLQAKDNIEAVLCDEKRAKDLDTKD